MIADLVLSDGVVFWLLIFLVQTQATSNNQLANSLKKVFHLSYLVFSLMAPMPSVPIFFLFFFFFFFLPCAFCVLKHIVEFFLICCHLLHRLSAHWSELSAHCALWCGILQRGHCCALCQGPRCFLWRHYPYPVCVRCIVNIYTLNIMWQDRVTYEV